MLEQIDDAKSLTIIFPQHTWTLSTSWIRRLGDESPSEVVDLAIELGVLSFLGMVGDEATFKTTPPFEALSKPEWLFENFAPQRFLELPVCEWRDIHQAFFVA